MDIKIGEPFKGKDCHGGLISGTICKVLDKTVIVETGIKHFVVKKCELKKDD